MSPSVYDTAQLLRFSPPADPQPALEWLLAQQHPDGGWSGRAAPYSRTLPTLAAIVTLQTAAQPPGRASAAVEAGLRFLLENQERWRELRPDELPIGVELLLPRLLHAAIEAGLPLSLEPYQPLIALGQKRLARISQMAPRAGTPLAHSWEGWGSTPDPELLDSTGGMGLSPAATAAWLWAARERPDLEGYRARARRYLVAAEAATGTGIPGVVPFAFPIHRFEQGFGLFSLLLAGVLRHPALEDVVQPRLRELSQALRPSGIGFADMFTPDGDDTAAVIALLRAGGHPVDPAPLRHFEFEDYYLTYPFELHPAPSATAHAVHALALCHSPPAAALQYLWRRRAPDGRWSSDKWHSSWLYMSSHVALALHAAGDTAAVPELTAALLAAQQPEGGWGTAEATPEETAYALFVLRQAAQTEAVAGAVARAQRWLMAQQERPAARLSHLWIGKELYCPYRINAVTETVGLLLGALKNSYGG